MSSCPPILVNKIYIGTKTVIERPTKGGYFSIHDKLPKVRGAQIFDPLKHSFNVLHDMDYRRSCDLIDIIDALFSRGESTLTKDTGLDYIADRLDEKPRTLRDLIPEPDKQSTTGHIWAYGKIRRLLRSPVLSRALCGSGALSVKPGGVMLARLDRAEIGEWDALALGLFLMAQFKGQLVVEDLGFYGRNHHTSLVREGRLIGGVNSLSELKRKAPELHDRLLLVEKVASGTTYDDAQTLAQYDCGFAPHTEGYDTFIRAAMA